MIKKILGWLFLTCIMFISFSFAWTFYHGNVSNFEDIELDNWNNTIWPATISNASGRWYYLKIWEKDAITSHKYDKYVNENMEGSYSYASYSRSNLNIKCKNWHIVTINSSYKPSNKWNWNIDSVKITYWTWNNAGSIISDFKATCKPIAKPIEKIEKITNINYKNIIQKENDFSPKFPITDTKVNITDEDIEKHFKPKQDIDNQPTFTDIVYLQLDLIWNLVSSVENTKEDFDFAKLFKTNEDFSNYNTWLEKFWTYTTKKDFQDAMSWAISLKDVWVAQEVIKWIYKCANNNNCIWIINFEKNPTNKYETYSLSDLQNKLYLSEDNILDNAISYTNYLSWTCGNISTITDAFLQKQIQNICAYILKTNLNDADEEDIDNYNLGYALWKRVQNLTKLKNKFAELKTWVNLLGVYNTYYELTHLNMWLDKISYIEKAKKETNKNKQYEAIRKIFEKEKRYIKIRKKINDPEWKKAIKRKVIEKIFTPWTSTKSKTSLRRLIDKWRHKISELIGNLSNKIAKNIPNFNIFKYINVNKVNWQDLTTFRWSSVIWDDIADTDE